MSDDKDRGTESLIPSPRAEIVSRRTSLARRGLNLLEAQKPTEAPAIAALRERANAGQADAQFELGLLYYSGLSVRQDDVQAARVVSKGG